MIFSRLIFFLALLSVNISISLAFTLALPLNKIIISHTFIFLICITSDLAYKKILKNKDKIFSYFLVLSMIKFICFLVYIYFFILRDSIAQLNHILNFFFTYFSYLVYDIIFLRKIN